ncbi:MAG: leucine-rich repeat domain-containing protein [Lachnospiraceae bacterium]|nr:leucine-rich repeat domain-containing protein [Lachnospiraceae bacterium]
MTAVRRKEHFGERELQKAVILPGTEEVGEWAFGFCLNLKEVWLPIGIRLSEKAFEGSDNIERVCLYSTEEELKAGRNINAAEETLALALLVWPGEITGLLDNYTDEKLKDFITGRLPAYLEEADDKGFKPFLAGGEEDYDDETSEREAYIFRIRLRKIRLALDALLLSAGDHSAYIRKAGAEALLSVLGSIKTRREGYVRLCFDKELFDIEELTELPERAAFDAELKAMLIRYSGVKAETLDMLEI